MPIPREVIDAVRERTDILAVVQQRVALRKKGGNHWGLCPFHDEKTPSFSVNASMGIFRCFGCNEGGDVFKFLQKTQGIGFTEAVRELAQAAGVEVPERRLTPDERHKIAKRASLLDVCDMAGAWFHSQLLTSTEGKAARDYLEGRGFSMDTIKVARLGYAPDGWQGLLNHLHGQGVSPQQAVAAGLARQKEGTGRSYDLFRGRLIIPIRDGRGRVVAFGGRVLEGIGPPDAPKYVNSPETEIYQKSKILYGLSAARSSITSRGRLLIVEGYFDVLALHQAGFTEAVATCGTALTADHMRIIRPLTRRVVVLFDGDEAGMRAAEKSLGMMLKAGIEPQRLDLGESKDPDEFIQAQGGEAFTALLERAEPLFELVLRRISARHGATPVGKEQTLADLAPLLRAYDGAARMAAIARVASGLGLNEAVVGARVGRGGRPSPAPAAPGMGEGSMPPRWRGSVELNHLLWLLIFHRMEVAPQVMEASPELISNRPSVHKAIFLLMEGKRVAELVSDLGDPDLERVLEVVSTRDVLYSKEEASQAASQILIKLRLKQIEESLAEVKQEMATCTASLDMSSFMQLATRQKDLQIEKRSLKDQLQQSGR